MDFRTRHPQDEATAFSKYLTNDKCLFTLRPDSCMCNACYVDCTKNVNCTTSTPRWVHIEDTPSVTTGESCCSLCKLDLLCYSPGHKTPSHFRTNRWGPPDWFQGLSASFWGKYFAHTRPNFNFRISCSSLLCHRHYMECYNLVRGSCCTICSNTKTLTMHFDDVTLLAISSSGKEITPLSWLCKECIRKGTSQSKQDQETMKYLKGLVLEAINVIRKEGIILRKDLVNQFQRAVMGYKADQQTSSSLLKIFDNLLTSEISRTENIDKVLKDSSNIGTMLYDKTLVYPPIAQKYYDNLIELSKQREIIKDWEKNGVKSNDIEQMIQKQTELFNIADSKLDYSSLFHENTNSCSKIFIPSSC